MDLSLLSMFTYSIKNFLVYNVVVQATNIINKGDFMETKTNSLWLHEYHIVFTPKYRTNNYIIIQL